MTKVELILAISLPILIVAAAAFVVYVLLTLSNSSVDERKDTRIFDFDLYSKKVKVADRKHSVSYRNEKHNKHGVIKVLRKKDAWVPLKEVLGSLYLNKDTENKFIKAFDSMETTKESQEFSFSHVISKKHYTINIQLYEKESKTGHILIISYKEIIAPVETNKRVKFTTKKQVISETFIYKGFVAFNLKHLDSKGGFETINMIKNIWHSDLSYFIHNKMLVVVFMSNSFKKNNKKIANLITCITQNAANFGGHLFYDGTSYITLKDVNTSQNLNRTLSALDFLIMLSIAKNKPFMTNQSKTFNIEEYKTYSKAFNKFKESIKLGEFETEYVPVKSMKTGRKVVNMVRPWVNGIEENVFRTIIKNNNNKLLLKDGFSKFVAVDQGISEPVFFNVNSSWLIDNAERIQETKSIFTLHLHENIDQPALLDAVKTLKSKGVIFAIKVNDLEEWIIPYIEYVEPKFIVLGKRIWNEDSVISSYSMIKLMKIKELTDKTKTKLIYENPSEVVDEQLRDKIDLNYYYNV